MNKSIIKKLLLRIRDDDITALASMLSYSILLSFFPFLIFIITFAGYSGLKDEYAILELKPLLPDSAYSLVSTFVKEILSAHNVNLLSFSIIFIVIAASNGFKAVIKGLNKAYDEEEHRSFIKIQILSLFCTLGLTVIAVITMLLLVFGQIITSKLTVKWNYSFFSLVIWNLLRYAIIISSMLLIFTLLYKFTPCKRLKLSEVFPGSVFACAGWIIVSIIFSFYVDNFGSYSKVYGSIGAVIILMIWIFLTSLIIISGGELNAVLAFDRQKQTKQGNTKKKKRKLS